MEAGIWKEVIWIGTAWWRFSKVYSGKHTPTCSIQRIGTPSVKCSSYLAILWAIEPEGCKMSRAWWSPGGGEGVRYMYTLFRKWDDRVLYLMFDWDKCVGVSCAFSHFVNITCCMLAIWSQDNSRNNNNMAEATKLNGKSSKRSKISNIETALG